MKIRLVLPMFVLALAACNNQDINNLNTASVPPAAYSNIPPLSRKDTVKLLLTPGGREDPYIETLHLGHEFKLVVNKNGDTIKLVTHDTTFVTPEGYRIGTSWNRIPLAEKSEVVRKVGYGYFLKLASGWTLGFCAGSECSNGELSNESKVVWIEK